MIWDDKRIGRWWWDYWEDALQKTPVFSSDVCAQILKGSPLYYNSGAWWLSDDDGPIYIGVNIVPIFYRVWWDYHTHEDVCRFIP